MWRENEIMGFLMYGVVRMYTWLIPYIKGMHLTVSRWRHGRAEDGFKWTTKEKHRRQCFLEESRGLPC